jgi:hypothetical protein
MNTINLKSRAKKKKKLSSSKINMAIIKMSKDKRICA